MVQLHGRNCSAYRGNKQSGQADCQARERHRRILLHPDAGVCDSRYVLCAFRDYLGYVLATIGIRPRCPARYRENGQDKARVVVLYQQANAEANKPVFRSVTAEQVNRMTSAEFLIGQPASASGCATRPNAVAGKRRWKPSTGNLAGTFTLVRIATWNSCRSTTKDGDTTATRA